MICQVKGSVVVGAILKVDGHQTVGRVAVVISEQNVSLLQVVVAKGHWRVNFEQELPEKVNSSTKLHLFCQCDQYQRCIIFIL